MELVDASKRRLLRIHLSSGAISSVPFELLDTAIAAKRTSDGSWIVQLRDSENRRLTRVRGAPVRIFSMLAHGKTDGFSFAIEDSAIFVTFRDPNFGVTKIDLTGRVDQKFTAHLASGLLPEIAVTSGRWVAINLLPAGAQLLLTLADARTGERMLVTIDSTGAPLRKSKLRGMFSFVTVDKSTNRAIAVRELNGQEVVVYRWGWRDTP